MTDTIKITSLSPMGTTIPGSSLAPVVDMSGTPTTKKATIANIANAILSQAGNGYVYAAKANLANIAGQATTVTQASQPNITSVGTLTSLTVSGETVLGPIGNVVITGGTNGYVLQTDGTGNLSWTAQTGGNAGNSTPGGANTQVQFNDAGSFGGDSGLTFNKTTNNLTVGGAVIITSGNILANQMISTGGSNIDLRVGNIDGPVFSATVGGAFRIPGGHVLETNIDNEFEIKSDYGVVISSDIANTNQHFSFRTDGIFHAPSNVQLEGTRLSIGPGASNVELEAPTVVINANSNVYVQAALTNENANGSADWVAYGSNGNDTGGWNDIGFTGYDFSDPTYTITGPGDGYVFTQGYSNGLTGGNLVLATGDQGTTKDIIFATNGFALENEFGRISDANNSFEITRANASLKFPDGTEQTTAYTGGGANLGNLEIADTTIMFANTANTSILAIAPSGPVAGWAYLLLPDNGNANVVDTELTNDAGNVKIITGDFSTGETAYEWKFDNTGTLTAPGDITVTGDITGRAAANTLVIKAQPTTDTYIQLNSIVDSTISTAANLEIRTDASNTAQIWKFNSDGTLTTPSMSILGNVLVAGTDPETGTGFLNLDNGSSIMTIGTNNDMPMVISLNQGGGSPAEWTFGTDGNLALPGNIYITNGGKLTTENNQLVIGSQEFDIRTSINSSGPGYDLTISSGSAGGTANATSNLHLNGGGTSVASLRAGNVYVTGGASSTGDGGDAVIRAGESTFANYGRVIIENDTNSWVFDSNGNLTLPGDYTVGQTGNTLFVSAPGTSDGIYLDWNSEVSFFAGNAGAENVAQIATTGGSWTFGTDGRLSAPGIIAASGNITTTANISTSHNLDVTGFIYTSVITGRSSGALSLTGSNIDVTTGNVNFNTATAVKANVIIASGNITGANLVTSATVFADTVAANSANISGNILVDGNITATTDLTLRAGAGGTINFPVAGGNIEFDAATGNVVFPGGVYTGDQSVTGNVSVTGNISGNTNGYTIGYLNIPQVSASNTTLALGDAGKHYYSTTAGNLTLTIPNNATTSFATGTAINIVVQAAGNVLVNADSGVTLYMAGSSTSGNRAVGAYGMATLMKVASDTWFISGAGVY